MAIKSVLCVFGGAERELGAVQAALMLGKIYAAQVRFLHVSLMPSIYAGIAGEGALISAEMVEATRKDNAQRLKQARHSVESLASQHKVPLDAKEAMLRHASAQFVHATDYIDKVVVREGRLSDLVVLTPGTSDLEVLYDYGMVSALFDTGRPVLLIPPAKAKTPRDWHDKTVVVAWDGGLEASRALFNALPLLEKAEKVYVLIAREHWKKLDLKAESAVMAYLRAHDVHAQVTSVDCGKCSIGERLLAKANELKADLLVAGAYGHSRFREMILGGTTNHLIEKSDIPLLLSH